MGEECAWSSYTFWNGKVKFIEELLDMEQNAGQL